MRGIEPAFAKDEVVFSALGDMPYKKKEAEMLQSPNGKIYLALRKENPSVVIHYGDFKKSKWDCTDELFLKQREQIYQLNPGKVVYTPGDNDWTDCDRKKLSLPFDELGRLQYLRELFFGKHNRLSEKLPFFQRQKELIENSAWRIKNLQFGTLHIVGTNNARDEILMNDKERALQEVEKRDKANLQWITYLFEKAKTAEGLVIAFQADIYIPEKGKPDSICTKDVRQKCDAYKVYREILERKAKEYQKPFLIIHGESDPYCFYQPNKNITNYWLLNGPGDRLKRPDAVVITFRPEKNQPFKVQGLLTKKDVSQVCHNEKKK